MADPRPMLDLDETLTRLVDTVRRRAALAHETVGTEQALGRILAQDLVSPLDVPPEDNSAMDGYALRAADAAEVGAVLPVSQRIPAGLPASALEPGTAARIFTGAQIPAGADVVVMQELTAALPHADGLGEVRIDTAAQPGRNIRRRGEDVRLGEVVLRAGVRLTPQALGLAASVGAARLTVAARPRVALLTTGDELVMPGEALPAGAIYNSNRFLLTALLQACGCEVIDLGIVPDRLDATREALRQASQRCDLILSSGGVSVGEEDHLRPAVQAEGSLDLWKIAIKPGKPLAFGSVGQALFMGLPGNPVSSFVTFVLTVAPVLRAMQGADPALPRALGLRAGFDWPRPDRRREFLRVRLDPHGSLELFPNQSSGVLTSAVWADGLVDNPPGQVIRNGDEVRFLPMDSLIGR